jgi:hypothetical protein
MLLIVASPHHPSPTPLKVNLGTHTLIITSESDPPEPVPDISTASARFDHEEAYKLYLCLHVLFQPVEPSTEETM